MFSKLPRWVFAGGALLVFIAGIINATGFLDVQHQGTNDLTGAPTLLGIAISHHDGSLASYFAALIGAVMVNCVVGGLIIQDSSLRLGRRYGVVQVPVDQRRMRLLFALELSFLASAVAGVWLFDSFNVRALYVPALTGVSGAAYAAYRQLTRHRCA